MTCTFADQRTVYVRTGGDGGYAGREQQIDVTSMYSACLARKKGYTRVQGAALIS
jgi:hypothetical protein